MTNRSVRIDVTAEQLHSLSGETRELLDALPADRPVFIQAFISPDVPEPFVQTRSNLISILEEIDVMAGSRVEVLIQDTEPFTDAAREARETFGIQPRPIRNVSTARSEVEDVFLGVAFTCGAEEQVVGFFDVGLPTEYEIMRSIRVVAGAERKRVGVVSTMANLFGGANFQRNQFTPQWSVITELRKQYDVVEISPEMAIEQEVDVLLVPLPSSLQTDEQGFVADYIRSGKPALILVDPLPAVNPTLSPTEWVGDGNPFTYPPGQPRPGPRGNVREWIRRLGVDWEPTRIVWDSYNPHPELAHMPEDVVFLGAGNENPATFDAGDAMTSQLQELVFLFPGFLQAVDDPRFEFQPLLRSGMVSGANGYFSLVRSTPFGPQVNPSPPRRQDDDDYVIAARIRSVGGAPVTAVSDDDAGAAEDEDAALATGTGGETESRAEASEPTAAAQAEPGTDTAGSVSDAEANESPAGAAEDVAGEAESRVGAAGAAPQAESGEPEQASEAAEQAPGAEAASAAEAAGAAESPPSEAVQSPAPQAESPAEPAPEQSPGAEPVESSETPAAETPPADAADPDVQPVESAAPAAEPVPGADASEAPTTAEAPATASTASEASSASTESGASSASATTPAESAPAIAVEEAAESAPAVAVEEAAGTESAEASSASASAAVESAAPAAEPVDAVAEPVPGADAPGEPGTAEAPATASTESEASSDPAAATESAPDVVVEEAPGTESSEASSASATEAAESAAPAAEPVDAVAEPVPGADAPGEAGTAEAPATASTESEASSDSAVPTESAPAVDVEEAVESAGADIDVIVVADLDFISEQFFQIREQAPGGLNFDNVTFFLNAMDTLLDEDAFIDLRSRRARHRTLERVEAQTAEFIEQRTADEQQAEVDAEAALTEAQQRLNDRVAELQGRADIDAQTRQIMVRNLEEVENRRLDVLSANITTEKDARIQASRENMEAQIRRIQTSIKTFAILLPPVPVVVLGIAIFIRRKRREREGAAAAHRLRE